MSTFGYDPFNSPRPDKEKRKAEKLEFERAEEQRKNLYESTGIEYDKDADGRVFPKASETNKRLGISAPKLTDDGRVDLESRREVDSFIQTVPRTPEKIDQAKERRRTVREILRGQRAELEEFDTQWGVKRIEVPEWDETTKTTKTVERLDFDGIEDEDRRDALLQTRQAIEEERRRAEKSLNEIDVEIGNAYLARQEWIRRQRERLGAKPGDVPELDDESASPEIGSPEWYQAIEAHGGVVGGGRGKKAPLPSPFKPQQGTIVGPDDPIPKGNPNYHRIVEGQGDNVTAKVWDRPLGDPSDLDQAQQEQGRAKAETSGSEMQPDGTMTGSTQVSPERSLAEVSGSYRRFMEKPDQRGNPPSDFEQAVWMEDRLGQIDGLEEKAGEKGKSAFATESAMIREALDQKLSGMNAYQLSRFKDKTRDPDTLERIHNFGARMAASAGSGLVDMADFAQRNYLRFHPLGMLHLKALDAMTEGDQTAASNVGSRFLDAMRETAEDWGPNVPDEVRAKLMGSGETMFAEGLGSAASFMVPGAAVGQIGRLAGIGEKALRRMLVGTTATAGAAANGNALRREVVQNNKQILDQAQAWVDAGEMSAEDFETLSNDMRDRANYAEAMGAFFGLSEALPLGTMLNRANKLGGDAVSKSILKRIFKSGGTETAQEMAQDTAVRKGLKVLGNGMAEAGEESLQEYYQTLAENAVASGAGPFSDKMAWDKDRDLMEGTVAGMTTGGAVGATISLLVSAMPGRQRTEFGEVLREEMLQDYLRQKAAEKVGPEKWQTMSPEDHARAADEMRNEIDEGEMGAINESVEELLNTPPAPGSGIREFTVTQDHPELGKREIKVFAESMDDALDQLSEQGINDNITVESAPEVQAETVPTTVFTSEAGEEVTIEGNPVEARKKLPEGFTASSVRTGEPIRRKTSTGAPATEEDVPVEDIVVNKDVPQFKEDADPASGIVEGQRLEGDYDAVKGGRVVVWEKSDGEKEIITGRHRLDLAKRSGLEEIPAFVVREEDGFGLGDAMVLDAEFNIADGQGRVKDYAYYFKQANVSRDEALERGLLSRDKGRQGWALGQEAVEGLYDLYANGQIAEAKAAAIASAAPGNEPAQMLAAKKARENRSMTADELRFYAQQIARLEGVAEESQAGEQTGFEDMLGGEDFQRVEAEAERIALAQAEMLGEINERIRAANNAARNPGAAREMGIDVRDPEATRRQLGQLRQEAQRLSNPDAETMDRIRERAGLAERIAQNRQKGLRGDERFERAIQRALDEAQGQEILDQLELEERRPSEINRNFWEGTYRNLPRKTQRRFDRYVESLTGMVLRDGETWADIALKELDIPDAVSSLQGEERGLVVLMEVANRQVAEGADREESVPVIDRNPESVDPSLWNEQLEDSASQAADLPKGESGSAAQDAERDTSSGGRQEGGRSGVTPDLARRFLKLPAEKRSFPMGPSLKAFRREVLEQITGETPPAKKMGATHVRKALVDALGIDTDLTDASIDEAVLSRLAEIASELSPRTPQEPAEAPAKVDADEVTREAGKATPARRETAKEPEIVGYEWRSEKGEKFSAWDGGIVPARVSDWSNAETSELSGRKIVHVYWIRESDGSVKPYGKVSAMKRLGHSTSDKVEKIAQRLVNEAEARKRNFEAQVERYSKIKPDSANTSEAKQNWLSRNKGFSGTVPKESRDNVAVWKKDGGFLGVLMGDHQTPQMLEAAGWELAEASASGIEQTLRGPDLVPDETKVPSTNQAAWESSPSKKRAARNIAGGSALAAGGQSSIDDFVPDPSEHSDEELKLFEASKALIKKHSGGKRIMEGRNPNGTMGVSYANTGNIAVAALNNIGVAAHETAHNIDRDIGLTQKTMRTVGTTRDGKPKYDPATAKERRLLTDVYVEYYPGGKRTHPLRTRMLEGFATFVQKSIEDPRTMRARFPELTSMFLNRGGKYFDERTMALFRDARAIVNAYNKLDPLRKIGARMTNSRTKKERRWLSARDKVETVLFDRIWPVEKAATVAGVEMTENDPSVYLREYERTNRVFAHNVQKQNFMMGGDTFVAWRDGEFRKVAEFNWSTLLKGLRDSGTENRFDEYLVARRTVADFRRLDEIKAEWERLKAEADQYENDEDIPKELVDEMKAAAEAYRRLNGILEKNRIPRNVAEQAVDEARRTLPEVDRFERMFDALVRADLDTLKEAGILSDEQHARYSAEDGYATFKRDVYDDLVDPETGQANPSNVTGKSVGSLKRRTGSEKAIISPLYSSIANHNEILHKSMRQIIWNKMGDLADAHPDTMGELMQREPLEVSYNPSTGVAFYPQDNDPAVIMARRNGKRVPYAINSDLKSVLDTVLTPEAFGIAERILTMPTRMFTKGTTALYPPFAFMNFVVDQVTATAQTRTGYVPVVTQLKLLAKALGGESGREAELLKEYITLAGATQTFTGWNELPPNKAKELVAREASGLSKITKTIRTTGRFTGVPSQGSEIFTRASEYMKARMNGDNQIVALEKAGRVTAPFHHIGSWGSKPSTSHIGRTWVRTLPYFNAALQVSKEYAKAMTDGRKKQAMTVTALLLASKVAELIPMMLLASDDQKEKYKDIEPDYFARYIFVPHWNGTDILRFRVPEQMTMFAAPINLALQNRMLGNDYAPADMKDAAIAWLPDQFDPTEPTRFFLSWMPHVGKVTAETIMNKRTWPEVRDLESLGIQQKLPQYRTYSTTSRMARELGELAGLSPIKIDHLLEGILGRSFKMITKPGSELEKMMRPFLQPYYFGAARSVQDFYEQAERNDQVLRAALDGEMEITNAQFQRIRRDQEIARFVKDKLKRYREIEDEEVNGDEAMQLRQDILEWIHRMSLDPLTEPTGEGPQRRETSRLPHRGGARARRVNPDPQRASGNPAFAAVAPAQRNAPFNRADRSQALRLTSRSIKRPTLPSPFATV